jgi:hypothetical protein
MKNSIESNDRAKHIENGDLDKTSIDTVQSKQKSEDRSVLGNNNINTSNKVESKETPNKINAIVIGNKIGNVLQHPVIISNDLHSKSIDSVIAEQNENGRDFTFTTHAQSVRPTIVPHTFSMHAQKLKPTIVPHVAVTRKTLDYSPTQLVNKMSTSGHFNLAGITANHNEDDENNDHVTTQRQNNGLLTTFAPAQEGIHPNADSFQRNRLMLADLLRMRQMTSPTFFIPTEAPRNVVPDMQNDLFMNHVMSALTTKSTPSESEHHASVMPSFSLFNHNHDHHEHPTIASLTTNSWLHWDK